MLPVPYKLISFSCMQPGFYKSTCKGRFWLLLIGLNKWWWDAVLPDVAFVFICEEVLGFSFTLRRGLSEP